jgi:nucleoside-diphosphate-sugar epimerase
MAARCAGRLQGVPVTVLRLGSAYGPGMRGKSVFSIFIGRASQGQRLTVFGDGTQYRQWTHVRDIARGFAGALAQPEAAVGQTYNLVAPEKVTIGEMAQRIAERYGVELTYVPARPGDVPPALVSSEKAYRDLGWEAEIAFADGLEELLSRGTA